MEPKLETIRKIANVVLVCDVEFGHLKWTIVEISKRSKVSRTLIYRYLGKSKLSILENSLRTIFDSLYLMGDFQEKSATEKERLEKLCQKLKQNTRQIRKDPKLSAFATLHYAEKNRLGEILRQKEVAYIEEQITKKFDLTNKLQAKVFRIFTHGLVNGHFLSVADQDEIAEFISSEEFFEWLRKI